MEAGDVGPSGSSADLPYVHISEYEMMASTYSGQHYLIERHTY